MERNAVGFGIEVKNEFSYMDRGELTDKLRMCQYLGIRPLFIVRVRDPNQREDVSQAGGFIYMFKTKIYPPGQESLVKTIWNEMKLPVDIWDDWKPNFYRTIGAWIDSIA